MVIHSENIIRGDNGNDIIEGDEGQSEYGSLNRDEQPAESTVGDPMIIWMAGRGPIILLVVPAMIPSRAKMGVIFYGGKAGNDVIDGGDEDDKIWAEVVTIILFGAGSDTISGGYFKDSFKCVKF